ncbi:MAG: hypothetical protein KAJ52_00565 [Sedimentisphaerales bacterium]|nr:hypothetical protein [Sedimentisphaerales bacterium]
MSFRENVSSDSGQIEKARQDLLLACREAADRAQLEQEQQKQKQEQQQKSFSEAPRKPQETPPEVNFEIPQIADEESVITIEQADPDETEQSVPAETDEISPTVQNQRQKMIPSYRNHNPFIENILKGIVSEDINRLRRQLADKP